MGAGGLTLGTRLGQTRFCSSKTNIKTMKHLAIVVLAMVSTLSAGDDRAFVASASGQFGTVDTGTGQFILIGFTPKVLSGLAIGPKKALYGLDADNNLVSINPQTAAATLAATIGLPLVPNGT